MYAAARPLCRLQPATNHARLDNLFSPISCRQGHCAPDTPKPHTSRNSHVPDPHTSLLPKQQCCTLSGLTLYEWPAMRLHTRTETQQQAVKIAEHGLGSCRQVRVSLPAPPRASTAAAAALHAWRPAQPRTYLRGSSRKQSPTRQQELLLLLRQQQQQQSTCPGRQTQCTG